MQINLTRKEDARAIAEKITARNYDPEETTQKSKGKEKELHGYWFFVVFFFLGDAMKNQINFQLYFNLPTYISNGEM